LEFWIMCHNLNAVDCQRRTDFLPH
jgi:hypothetical protein